MTVTLVNIGGDPNDVNHRYKRERIAIERINRKGGMRRIKNLRKIIGQLSQSDINIDAFEREFYDRVKKIGLHIDAEGWFKGDITDNKLEDILNRMIKEIVLCPKCLLPEWDHKYCRSCGYFRKTKKSKRQSTTDPDDESTRVIASEPHLVQAVQMVHKMYDLYATRHHSNNTDWNLLETHIARFWEIDNSNELVHKQFVDKMSSIYSFSSSSSSSRIGLLTKSTNFPSSS